MRPIITVTVAVCLFCGMAYPQRARSKEDLDARVQQLEQKKQIGQMARREGRTLGAKVGFGGGVCVNSGVFELNGGTISGNAADAGGGVYVASGGVFGAGGTFTMTGGTVSGNTASDGGGVFAQGSFAMKGGVISGNTAKNTGGGVKANGYFSKTGGTITGYKSDPANGNAVKDEDDNVTARSGHAIFVDVGRQGDAKRKETTAGSNANFSKDGSGPWDQ
jgi:hypothetical protein